MKILKFENEEDNGIICKCADYKLPMTNENLKIWKWENEDENVQICWCANMLMWRYADVKITNDQWEFEDLKIWKCGRQCYNLQMCRLQITNWIFAN